MKKRKIIIALLLATGIFVNISNNTSSNGTSANSFIPLSSDGPIIGNHNA